MKLYGLKNCDTCRKALKALEASGKKVTFLDVRAEPITNAQLNQWSKAAGWEKILNTRSTTWRALTDQEKTDVCEKKAINLMGEHPTLIKRPVIEADGAITIGWTKDIQAKYL